MHVQQFSLHLDKFEVWVYCEAVWYIFEQFSVSFFKMAFNPLPDLVNTGFTIIEIGLFYGGERLGAKIYRFLTFFDIITSIWRFLVGTKSGMTTCENTLKVLFFNLSSCTAFCDFYFILLELKVFICSNSCFKFFNAFIAMQ